LNTVVTDDTQKGKPLPVHSSLMAAGSVNNMVHTSIIPRYILRSIVGAGQVKDGLVEINIEIFEMCITRGGDVLGEVHRPHMSVDIFSSVG
jgi:hypothetical protein